ncbi:hypothetical protein [Sabulicella rubraurantiaca]|uniref:hypothetical protein n=1 Tax=Sabulicella rubraurantiaca TaxID=2811429 RepID=UPI001A9696D0|nr:hypothetical protein [Sabulicella rubraurantiaca]
MKILVWAAAALVAAGFASVPAHAQGPRTERIPGGEVRLEWPELNGDPRLRQTLAIGPTRLAMQATDLGEFSLQANGRALLTGEEGFGGFAGVYPAQDRTFVLLTVESGGRVCPARFRILEMGQGGMAVSPAFGTCAPNPRATVTEDGRLRVQVAAWQRRAAQVVTFRDGAMREGR